MQRREFLSLSGLAAVAIMAPVVANGQDFRKVKPTAWTAHTVEDGIAAMYGTAVATQSGIKITMPEEAANGASVPINIKSDIDVKSIAIFQDANPESAVAAFTVHENSIIDYDLQIKLKSVGTPITVTVIAEARDGKLYSGTKTITVALGGCEG